jgi:hypothetical protein
MAIGSIVPETNVVGRYWWWLAPSVFAWNVIACIRVVGWHCPRCDKLYFTEPGSRVWWRFMFVSRCWHCGLPKWAPPNTPDQVT